MALDILGEVWNISQRGEEIITENFAVKDKATILRNALNSDLKETGAPILSKFQNKNYVSQVVLQIQKLRNISAPKANENSQAAPRMLKLVLTDGDGYIQAIEITFIPWLNLDKTAPGSKLLIYSAKICSGYLLLDSNNCSLLGGQVPALYEKWELTKSVQFHSRQTSSSDGPPSWVNFGCKIQTDIQDKSFKSLDNKNQETKENSKFELQRQDAIAEATSGAIKKVFGGGVKQSAQPMYNPKSKQNDFHYKDKKNNKSKFNANEVEDKPLKPSERVSLFDFLEDKLPSNEHSTMQPAESTSNGSNYYQRGAQSNFLHNKSHARTDQNMPNKTRIDYKSHSGQTKIEENVNGLTNSFEKISLNTQFASRSLKQHLNLGPQKKKHGENSSNIVWNLGDDCVAKYWEDGKYYNATITAVTDKTCVVKFKGYGNIEEVLKDDCLPVVNKETSKKSHYTGPVEFRRNARTYRRQ